MIAATIDIPLKIEHFETVPKITLWLETTVGPCAESRDYIRTEKPWYVDRSIRGMTFHFLRNEDAALFALKWI